MTTRSPLDAALDALRDAVTQAEEVLASRAEAGLTEQVAAAADVYGARLALRKADKVAGGVAARDSFVAAVTELFADDKPDPKPDVAPGADSL